MRSSVKKRQLALLGVMPRSRGKVPAATQQPPPPPPRMDLCLEGPSLRSALHPPHLHHHRPTSISLISPPCLLESSHTQTVTVTGITPSRPPRMAPAHPRVHNGRATHGWTDARAVTTFCPEAQRRHCSHIWAVLLRATCWLATSPAANSI